MLPQFDIQIWYLLIPYGFFLLFYIMYSIFSVYHMLRFGVYGYGAYLIITVYAGVTIFMLGAAVYFLMQLDWSATMALSEIIGGGSEEELFNLEL